MRITSHNTGLTLNLSKKNLFENYASPQSLYLSLYFTSGLTNITFNEERNSFLLSHLKLPLNSFLSLSPILCLPYSNLAARVVLYK